MTDLWTTGSGERCLVLDFDGTVTEVDVVDNLIECFAQGDDWKLAEELWRRGVLSSHECLSRQLSSVSISAKELDSFLKSVRLDPGFERLVRLAEKNQVPWMILSDGFDLFIQTILGFRGFTDFRFLSNHLRLEGLRLVPEFPHVEASRKSGCNRCGNCKRRFFMENRARFKSFLFAGDGFSDQCAADAVDRLFAKGSLAEYCRENGLSHMPFETLGEVADALEHEWLAARNVALRGSR